ncbi:baseplate J/gp47 family protein [Lachnoclostridium phytofermentans]|uniref:Baseplate J family protein n=1 Tax=Lachnoclostridium phytofermentans (strain ATCC 700394 / DSM 18823 / ISDg) TaxID=357809 RepID=A9KPN3_LACP7|nr:baseplate J/gp47 family protein [Lachnoclostridium phytofermentans]ABX43307.1 Baseplate J family protein [Lachnoclostridium phytofermentans ISDg]
MYEDMTYEVILNRALARIPPGIDKREGSMIYTAVAPVCAELAQMYVELEGIMNESFADTASRDFLIRRAAERGLTPKEATYAVVKGVINIDIPIGARFTLDKFSYRATEKISAGAFKLTCETPGSSPNSSTGVLLPVEYIDGLTSASITEILIPGEEEEDTEVFRKRYFDSLDAQAFGGNRADYKAKVLSLDGVGAVKIYRATNVSGEESGGNVKLVILNSDHAKPSATLVDSVQSTIDPITNGGDGLGLAPLWHFVHVTGADETVINITTTITYQSGYTYEDVKSYIASAIDGYFKDLAKSWQDEGSSGLVVRISRIDVALLGIPGIVDVTGTMLNGSAVNIELDKNAIPVRGSLNGS